MARADTTGNKAAAVKGRGAGYNPENRFTDRHLTATDDGWPGDDDPPPHLHTHVQSETARSIISFNQSPDVPFDRSINPYRGCEHGCVYCFARPSHAFLDLSPGLDFETRLFAKHNAVEVLRRTLSKPSYRPATIALGVNTDAYQPIQRERRITRSLLELLLEARHPVGLITKSALIERDLDLLQDLAQRQLVEVAISLTTLDNRLARRLEPRAAAPHRRLKTIARLTGAGIPVQAMLAPVIPALTDHEMEALLQAAHAAGARHASYVLLRLPHEVAPLFEAWLEAHTPDRAEHVLNRVRELRAGKLYDNRFGQRMRGDGKFAELYRQRFRLAIRRLGLDAAPPELDSSQFRPPRDDDRQLDLFSASV